MTANWKAKDIALYLGDCLDIMPRFKYMSFDMILCDLPYGTTACKWDTIIPFEPLWEQYKRIIKDNGMIVLMASQPFTSKLIISNLPMFQYCWFWEKEQGTGINTAKLKPLRIIEEIAVFYKNKPSYFPQMIPRKKPLKITSTFQNKSESETLGKLNKYIRISTETYPVTLIKFCRDRKNRLHPTQKPIALFEYLIKTYTNERDIVLDNCIGSGTTAIACINTGRRCVGIEKDENYFKVAVQRISDYIKEIA
jgi:site-specific DNA-methyltransferase (adenine-specific)